MRSEFILPFPPSTNGLYANRKGGRKKTYKYKAWIDAAGWMIRVSQDRHNRHTGPVSLTISVAKPDNRRRDISNTTKAIEDLLVRHQILADDSLVVALSTQWDSSLPHGARVTIEDAQ